MDRKKLIIIAGAVIGLVIIIVIGILVFGGKGGGGIDCTQDPTNPKCSAPINSIDCEKDPTNEQCQVDCSVDPNNEKCKIDASLTIWGVFDESSYFESAIKDFNKQYPNVKVTYAKKQYSDYENTVIDAFASEEGPDIFAIQNDWLPKYKAKISPVNKEVLDTEEFNNTFTDVAYQDMVSDNKVYALPFYFDSLALYYNPKIFEENRIYEAPTTWEEVIAISKLITQKTTGNPNEITRAGIALGTSGNIVRANDILTALMLQTNTPIISQDKKTFSFQIFRKDENGEPYYPGTNALQFYTDFANPSKGAYSWNSSFENNIAAFANGRVAMIIGYQYFGSLIQRENINASFKVSAFPQIKPTGEHATLANYWGYSVSRNSENKELAWQFLLSTINNSLRDYLKSSGRTSPLKNDDSGVFGEQKDIARVIYKGKSEDYDRIFNEMIDDVVKYNQPLQSAIDTASKKANDMLSKYQ